MPIQRKNLFLTWGIRISLVPVILVLLALGLIAIVLFAICGVCGRFLAALGGLARALVVQFLFLQKRLLQFLLGAVQLDAQLL